MITADNSVDQPASNRGKGVLDRLVFGTLSLTFACAAALALPQAASDAVDGLPDRTPAGIAFGVTAVGALLMGRRAVTGRWTTPQTGDNRPHIFGS